MDEYAIVGRRFAATTEDILPRVISNVEAFDIIDAFSA